MTEQPLAWYNENDPHAAQWLRNLIEAGHIAPGVVDERDIRDVAPAELVRFTQCHFFAGIGLWSYALRSAGWPDSRPIWTGSCPCQPFSAAGKGEGFDDERHLWPFWHWIIANQPPERRPVVIVGEQVAGKDGLGWFDLVSDDLGGIGYASGAVDLSAAGFGVGWRGSAESQRLEWAIRDCPDSMVARHLAAFAEWADQALSIGGFHIRQRLYFVGLADKPPGGWGKFGDAVEPGQGGHLDGGGHPSGGLPDSEGGGCAPGRIGTAPGRPAVESDGHSDDGGMANRVRGGAGSAAGNGDRAEEAANGSHGGAQRAVSAAGNRSASGGVGNELSIGQPKGRHGDHRRHDGPEPSADGADGGMGDGQRPRSQRQRGNGHRGHKPGRIAPPAPGSAAAASDAHRVEHPAGIGHHGGAHAGSDQGDEGAGTEAEAGRAAGLQHAEGTGPAFGLAHAHGGDGSEGREQLRGEHGRQPEDGGVAGRAGGGLREGEVRVHSHGGGADPGGRKRGSVDWLLCRDGVWRPAEPGTFPLAHAVVGRVGRLRAYGNGLDLETAKGFLGSVMAMLRELDSHPDA